jgi:hypothetical protein
MTILMLHTVSPITKNLFYFITGGIILVLINYLAINVNSTSAALLWAFPVLSLPAYYFVYLETKNRNLIMNMNTDIILFFFVNLTFFLFLYYFLNHTRLHIYKCFLFSLILFIVIATLVYCVIRKVRTR